MRFHALLAAATLALAARSGVAVSGGLTVYTPAHEALFFEDHPAAVEAWPAASECSATGNAVSGNAAAFTSNPVFDSATNGVSDISFQNHFFGDGAALAAASAIGICDAPGGTDLSWAAPLTAYSITQSGDDDVTIRFTPPVRGVLAQTIFLNDLSFTARLDSGTDIYVRSYEAGVTAPNESRVGFSAPDGDLIEYLFINTGGGEISNAGLSGLWVSADRVRDVSLDVFARDTSPDAWVAAAEASSGALSAFAWPSHTYTTGDASCSNDLNTLTETTLATNGVADTTWTDLLDGNPSSTVCFDASSNGYQGDSWWRNIPEPSGDYFATQRSGADYGGRVTFSPAVGAVMFNLWVESGSLFDLFFEMTGGRRVKVGFNELSLVADTANQYVGVVAPAGETIDAATAHDKNLAPNPYQGFGGLYIAGPSVADCVDTVTLGSAPLVGIDGDNLLLSFDVPNVTSVAWAFQGASAACDAAATTDENGWTAGSAAVGCTGSRSSFSMPLTQALASCNFGAIQTGANGLDFYETVLEATTVRPADDVFGDGQTRTDVTSFRLRVEFPTDVSVNGTAGVFGAVIDRSALTEQTFDSVTQEFGWNLATSVQYPYYLEPVSTAVSGGHTFDTLPVVLSGGDCGGVGTDAAPAACTQDFALSANETDDCFVPAGTTVTVTFQILCRPQYAGSCDLPEGNTTTASFSVETDDFCPRVVEVASITPSLTTYSDSGRTSVSTNYILETTLFARVTADVEAGLQAKRTTLTGLDIVSSCTGCTPLVQPFPDTSAASTAYGFAYASGGTDNSATGEVETDFSFVLNTNSLSFDNDASTGEAQITLTAYVSVEYDTPSAQGLQRSYRVQAVSGPGSVGSSASANFGVSSAPAGGTTGGSSSTAGSTVLGVSTGTAALAAVGLAAVAAVAVGAAVAARRRSSPLQPLKRTSSSAATQLELSAPSAAPSAASAAVPGMATDDLSAVQTGYASV